MGQEDVSHGRTLKPKRFDDDDADFPEFEFPVGDAVARHQASLLPERGDNGAAGSALLLRASSQISESPKKMPLAILENGRVTVARVAEPPEATQPPETSKHVVAESESKIPNPAGASSAPQRKVLSPNPSFKSLVTLLGEPPKVRTSVRDHANGAEVSISKAGQMNGNGDSAGMHGPLSAPSSKRLNSILSRVSAKVTAQGADPAASKASPERLTSSLSVNVPVLVEKFAAASARAVSPRHPGPRNLASPRRVMADRSRSPTPRQLQESRPVTPRPISSPRRGSLAERSGSPVPARSWKDSVYSDLSKERRASFSSPGPVSASPPRFLTPTQAAALKTVASPSPKASQYTTTAFGITTPVNPATPSVWKPAPPASKTSPSVTKPAGFNFRTDERAERRRDFYSKLEGRLKVKEEERRRAEMKALEEKESQLRELRKSLGYKANPVPRFYQEPAPAPTEIRKVAPTRAKSPNFSTPRRRDSCPAAAITVVYEPGRLSPLRSTRSLSRSESLKSSLPKPKLPFRPV